MREILFRGKKESNGEWVEGSLHIEYGEWDKDGNRTLDYRILGKSGQCDYVIPETVGQYTGLTDKNGKKIFEGDIVIDKYCREKFGFVGVVIYNSQLTQFQIYSDKQPDYVVNLGSRRDSVKIIGNIHDNKLEDFV